MLQEGGVRGAVARRAPPRALTRATAPRARRPLVLRTQLPRSNAFLPFDAGDGVPTATFVRPTALCPVSGMPCPASESFACAACAERASEAEERPACRCEPVEEGYQVTYSFGG